MLTYATPAVAGSHPSVSDLQASSFSAGVAEGAVTCDEIAAFGANVLLSTFGTSRSPNQEVAAFVEENDRFVRGMAGRNAERSDYWLAVSQLYAQLDGLLAGYNDFSVCSKQSAFVPMSKEELLYINLDGDLFDLMSAFPDSDSMEGAGPTGEQEPFRSRRKDGKVNRRARGREDEGGKVLRCSSLFKITLDDVFFGHTTWDTYSTATPRIFKSVTLPVRRGGKITTHTDSFSSSPGFIASIDDYYLLGGTSTLGVVETSNDVYDLSAYDYLKPQCVFCWARTMAANMLAYDGESWGKIFGNEFHSGTYNNQWLLDDSSKFTATTPRKGLFWVLEEAPGLIHAEDQTEKLIADGYWGSYNVAYYADIRERIGETGSYVSCPRANIFRELQGNVTTIEE